MREVGALIAEVLDQHRRTKTSIAGVRQKVEALTARFPLYDWKLDSRVLGALGMALAHRHRCPAHPGLRDRHVHPQPGPGAWRNRQRQPIHPGQRPGGRARARRAAGQLSARPSMRAATHSSSRSLAFPAVPARPCARPGAHSAEPRAAADDPALRGDDPRHGEPALRRSARRSSACSCGASVSGAA